MRINNVLKSPVNWRLYFILCLAWLGLAAWTWGTGGLFAAGPAADESAGETVIHRAGPHQLSQSAGGKSPELGDSSSVGDYLDYAALNNPGLEALFYRWQAALEKVPQARALPDARLSYSYYIREVETRVGPQRQRVGIAQTFPWFGKLTLRGEKAEQEAGALEQKFRAARLELFYRVKRACYDYYYLGRSLEITRENLALLESLESVARAGYSAGTDTYAGLIKAQVELGRTEDRLKSLEDYRGALAAVLNSELNRPPDTPLPWPTEPETGEVLPAEEELFGLLAERNPELRALDYNLEKEKTAEDLAGKDFYPDITLGLDYLQTGRARMPGVLDDSKDPVMATVSVNLPLNRGKYRAAGREARNRYGAARLERQDSQNRLEARLKAALFAFRDAGRRLSLYRDVLVPKAEQSLSAARQAYTTAGGADFLDLIEAQRTLLEFRLSGEKALVDRAKALAEIELLTGTDKIYL